MVRFLSPSHFLTLADDGEQSRRRAAMAAVILLRSRKQVILRLVWQKGNSLIRTHGKPFSLFSLPSLLFLHSLLSLSFQELMRVWEG